MFILIFFYNKLEQRKYHSGLTQKENVSIFSIRSPSRWADIFRYSMSSKKMVALQS